MAAWGCQTPGWEWRGWLLKFSIGCGWACSCSGMVSAIPGLPCPSPWLASSLPLPLLRWQLFADPRVEEGQSPKGLLEAIWSLLILQKADVIC